jgi:acetoin utilization deacetylase AcuC-like enzyme
MQGHANQCCARFVQVFNDIAVAIRYAQELHQLERILVIDLDVHQGNGTNSIFKDDPRVRTCDLYCDQNYPWSSRMHATHDYALPTDITDDEYLSVLKACLRDVSDFEPELIIFQAGVDALAQDTLGKMNLSRNALAARNNLVCSFALEHRTPMLITLGGGYARPDPTPSIEAHCDVFRVAAMRLGALHAASRRATAQ